MRTTGTSLFEWSIPRSAASRWRSATSVDVRTDDPSIGLAVCERLKLAGFARSQILVGQRAELLAGPAVLGSASDPGPLAKLDGHLEVAQLLTQVDSIAGEAGIDKTRYPLCTIDGSAHNPTLHLPLEACRSGRLVPYAGPFPERFRVYVLCDDKKVGAELKRRLLAKGFKQVLRRGLSDLSVGFRLVYGGARSEPEVVESLHEVVDAQMSAIGADGFPLGLIDKAPKRGGDVEIHVPAAAFRTGALAKELENPALYKASIRGGGAKCQRSLAAALKEFGFVKLDQADGEAGEPPRLSYGAAPRALVERLRDTVRQVSGDLAAGPQGLADHRPRHSDRFAVRTQLDGVVQVLAAGPDQPGFGHTAGRWCGAAVSGRDAGRGHDRRNHAGPAPGPARALGASARELPALLPGCDDSGDLGPYRHPPSLCASPVRWKARPAARRPVPSSSSADCSTSRSRASI